MDDWSRKCRTIGPLKLNVWPLIICSHPKGHMSFIVYIELLSDVTYIIHLEMTYLGQHFDVH